MFSALRVGDHTGSHLPEPLHHLLGHRRGRVLRIHAQEQHVLVDEVVPGRASALLPDIECQIVTEVVVAWNEKEGLIQRRDGLLDVMPLALEGAALPGIPLDEIADVDDEFGLHPPDLAHRLFEDTRTRQSGAITDDREVQCTRVGSRHGGPRRERTAAIGTKARDGDGTAGSHALDDDCHPDAMKQLQAFSPVQEPAPPLSRRVAVGRKGLAGGPLEFASRASELDVRF